MTLFNHVAKRGLVLIIVTTMAGYIYSMGCGSSGTATTDTSSGTISVTASVSQPTVANLAVAKGVGTKAVSDTAASGATCTLYTLEGETIGSATVNESGTVSIAADLAKLEPADSTGTSWTEECTVTCTTDAGVEISTYAEVTVDEASTTTVSLGTIDIDTTIAAEAVLKKVGCDPKKGTACTPPSGVDLACIFELQDGIFDSASTGGDGAADELGYFRDCLKANQAKGTKTADLGYSDWGDVIQAFQDKALTDGAMALLADACASALGSDATTIQNQLAAADDFFSSMASVVTDSFAASGIAAITTASLSTGKSVASSDSPCAKIKSTANYVKTIVGTLLESDSATELATTFTGDAAKFIFAILDKEVAAGGDLTKMLDDGQAIFSYCSNYITTNGSYSGLVVGGIVEVEAMEGVHSLMKTEWNALSEVEQQKQAAGWAMQTIPEAKGGGGTSWTTLCSSSGCNTTQIDLIGSYYEKDTFDPTTISTTYYQTLDTQFVDGYATLQTQAGSTTLDACAALTDETAKHNCYANAGIGGLTGTTSSTPTFTGGTPTTTQTTIQTFGTASTYTVTLSPASPGSCGDAPLLQTGVSATRTGSILSTSGQSNVSLTFSNNDSACTGTSSGNACSSCSVSGNSVTCASSQCTVVLSK